MSDLRSAAARIPIDWLWYEPDSGRYLLWNPETVPPEGSSPATGQSGPTVALRSVMGASISLPARLLSANEVPAGVVTAVLALALEDALQRFGAGLGQLASRDADAPARDLAALAAETDGAVQPVVERILARVGEPASTPALTAIDDALRLVAGALAFGPATAEVARTVSGLFSPEAPEAPEDDLQARIADEVSRDLAERAAARGGYELDLTNLFAPPADATENVDSARPSED
jgi:hypothetical protein